MSQLTVSKLKLGISPTQSNNFELDSSSANGTLVLNRANGQNILTVNPDNSLSFSSYSPIIRATARAATSGTSIDFLGIPAGVKRITVVLSNVSTNGTSFVTVHLGTSAGFVTAGYSSTVMWSGGSVASTGGMLFGGGLATNTRSGAMQLINITDNMWVASGTLKVAGDTCKMMGGDVTLSGTLDRIRLTTTNGTDLFDQGTVNILYEG